MRGEFLLQKGEDEFFNLLVCFCHQVSGGILELNLLVLVECLTGYLGWGSRHMLKSEEVGTGHVITWTGMHSSHMTTK